MNHDGKPRGAQGQEQALTFEDYQISDDVSFKALTYLPQENALIAYVFADDTVAFEKIVYQLTNRHRPNAFVDYYYIYVTDGSILSDAKQIISDLPLTKEETQNIGLFHYDLANDSVTEILGAAPNDSYVYQSYVKPNEIKKLTLIWQTKRKTAPAPEKRPERPEPAFEPAPRREAAWDKGDAGGLDEWDLEHLPPDPFGEPSDPTEYLNTLDDVMNSLSDEEFLTNTKEIIDYLNSKIESGE